MAPTPAISRRQFLSLSAPVPAGSDDGYWIRIHRRAMACRFEVVLPGEDVRFLAAARTALNLADRLEARLSVFRESSEVSRINRLAGEGPVPVHPGLFELLQRSAEIHAATGGAFDITSTPLSRCWGFLRRDAAVPTGESIARAREHVGMHLVQLNREGPTVRFSRAGVELNLGSIGKGYALDRMGAKLRRLGVRDVLLSAGGSSILAMCADGPGWPVDLFSRVRGGAAIGRLRLRNVAMATSGAGEQFVLADGRRYGHVLDPRTGWPASGVLSASVVTSEACVADALATAFLVEGPALAARYCAEHPDTLAVLVIEGDPACGDTVQVFGTCPGAMVERGFAACT